MFYKFLVTLIIVIFGAMTAMGVCVGFGDEQSSLGPFKSTVLSTAKMELGEARGDFPLCTTRLSGMPVAHNFEQAVASSKSPYSLPNEVLTKICEKMGQEDRKRFAAVDDRLNGLEAKAGCRRFKRIECTTNSWRTNAVKVCAEPGEVFSIDANSQLPAVVYFANARTELLSIKGDYEEESEKALLSVIKTTTCTKLLIELSDCNSIRLLKEVARMHKELREVSICVVKPQMDIDSMRNALLELHPIMSYHICVNTFQSPKSEFQTNLIDDEVLLHLVNSSKTSTKIDYHNLNITSAGIAESFKMVCLSVDAKRVEFTVPSRALKYYLSHLDYTKYERTSGINTIKHYHSGAYLDFFINGEFASVKMSCKGML